MTKSDTDFDDVSPYTFKSSLFNQAVSPKDKTDYKSAKEFVEITTIKKDFVIKRRSQI